MELFQPTYDYLSHNPERIEEGTYTFEVKNRQFSVKVCESIDPKETGFRAKVHRVEDGLYLYNRSIEDVTIPRLIIALIHKITEDGY